MVLVLIFVFVAAFAVAALLLTAAGTGSTQQAKRTLRVLEAALSTEKRRHSDPIVDIRKEDLLSAVPLLNRILLKMELAPRLRHILYQAQIKWTAGGLILMSAACFLLPAWLVDLRIHLGLVSLLIGVVFAAMPMTYVLAKRRARFRGFEQQLPEALDLMVSAIRAGHSSNSSFELVSEEMPDPIGGEFRICCDEQNYGLDPKTALNNLTYRVPLQDLKMVATAMLIQKDSGGNLAEILDKVSYVIRERFQLKRQVRVHTAQGRMTGWILSLLPVVLGLVLYLLNPKNMSLLWQREIGVKLMYASGAMTVIGVLVIRKIVNMEV